MLVDPRVARRKFERERQRVLDNADLLAARGCFIRTASYPNIDVLFVSLKPVQVITPVSVRTPAGEALRQVAVNYPPLVARPFLARIGLDDFDLRPPSVVFLNPDTKNPLAAHEVVRGRLVEGQASQVVVLTAHPKTGLPFLCLRGIREYHDHVQHGNEDWFRYRTDFGAFDVIDRIWQSCIASVRPLMRIVPGKEIRPDWAVEVGH